jgi:hypothetical protein
LRTRATPTLRQPDPPVVDPEAEQALFESIVRLSEGAVARRVLEARGVEVDTVGAA